MWITRPLSEGYFVLLLLCFPSFPALSRPFQFSFLPVRPSDFALPGSRVLRWQLAQSDISLVVSLVCVSVCLVCKVKVHKRCAVLASSLLPCKWTTLSSVGDDIIEHDNGVCHLTSLHFISPACQLVVIMVVVDISFAVPFHSAPLQNKYRMKLYLAV